MKLWVPFLLSIGVVVLTTGPASRADQVPQGAPQFRAGTWVVPVDVRVLDLSGAPIAGLSRDEFVLTEDGVPQTITHFEALTLTPAAAGDVALQAAPADALRPQNRRVFLIVLGRGRLQPPGRGVDGVLELVRNHLLPQDRVALFAYNRATDFTADRQFLVAMLERFRARHEAIEAKIRVRGMEDVDAIYGITAIPRAVQADIDALFDVPGGPPLRTPPEAVVAQADRLARDYRDARDILIGEAIRQERLNAGVAEQDLGMFSAAATHLLDSGFGGFVADYPRGLQDLTRLYQAIEFLRYLDGEKHLVYVSERGMALPRLEDHTSIAAMASDARVTINTIQTGGLPGTAAVPKTGASLPDAFNIHSLKTVSELTGGVSSIYAYASEGVRRIDAATRSTYLLGYTPANARWDGSFRRIEVRVTRPGARPLWRHGYYARDPRHMFDRRTALTYNRIAAAASFDGEVLDIPLKVDAGEVADGEGRRLKVAVTIDPGRIGWTSAGGDRTATLHIAMFAADSNGETAGQHWQAVPLRLPAELLERARASGLNYATDIPLANPATTLRVIVYDIGSDRLGSLVRRLRPR